MITLEQLRAQNAWEKSQGYQKEHSNTAKSLPALIMNSGLMQTLAFCHEKGSKEKYRHYDDVARALRLWLCGRFPKVLPQAEFAPFMESLMVAEPQDFQAITAEAFAWLRWLRQMAAAQLKEG
ncbi:MAG: type III-B CRISPR module-associated protein Cmr5 [Acidithiobacillus sp.]